MYGLHLYAVIVKKAHCCGQLGDLTFTKGETAFSIKMLKRVSHNPEVASTHIVIIDKNFAEVQLFK